MKAEFGVGFGGGLNDFVGECAALSRIGVVDDGHAACGAFGGEVNRFELADWTCDDDG